MKSVTTTLLFLVPAISFAQDQITSFKTGTSSSFTASRIVEYRDQLLFVSTDEHRGAELWTSDGTVAGTRLVKDIKSGEQFFSYRQVCQIQRSCLFHSRRWATWSATLGH
jgi:ELWxxDGT repeat protein